MSEATANLPLSYAIDGAQLFRGAVARHLCDLRALFADLPENHAGIRIHGLAGLSPFLAPDGPIGAIAAGIVGDECRAVRAILFDKTAEMNWALGWHQDRTICVRQRIEVEGFGPWTTKGGMQHVAPPFDILSRMVTLRIHLDAVPADNAPLLIAPGSHRQGKVPVDDIRIVAQACETYRCLADAGDIWLYATPILHGSDAAITPTHRRVLQVDYSTDRLPGGLEWLGV